ncbi:MAG: hypothetical protein CMP10_19525 [Zetaproteobacteria bacterium]|nr:hypothetical protein [Pseudobdellovibrionaceae bacterium]
MAFENRFRVLKEGSTLYLHGVISETTNFIIIDEMVRGTKYFNCENLESASWNGLLAFEQYLTNLDEKITLTKVPWKIYNYLRLFPQVNKSYLLDSIEILICDPKYDNLKNAEYLWFNRTQLEQLGREQGVFISWEEKLIVSKGEFILPNSNQDIAHKEKAWYKKNQEEVDFWHNYFCFANVTGYLVLNMIQSLQVTLENLLNDLEFRVQESESALNLLHAKEEDVHCRADQIHMIIFGFHTKTDKLYRPIEDVATGGSDLAWKLQKLALSDDNDNDKQLDKIIEDFCANSLTIEKNLSIIEEAGAKSGEEISILGVTKQLKKELDEVNDDKVTPEILEEVRTNLAILDPISDGDWPATKKLFLEHIEEIDELIEKSTVLLQGFDLLRQVLEHRLEEGQEILEFRERDFDFETIKQSIHMHINEHLVTVQEKYACRFFLPDASIIDQGATPGQTIVF